MVEVGFSFSLLTPSVCAPPPPPPPTKQQQQTANKTSNNNKATSLKQRLGDASKSAVLNWLKRNQVMEFLTLTIWSSPFLF